MVLQGRNKNYWHDRGKEKQNVASYLLGEATARCPVRDAFPFAKELAKRAEVAGTRKNI